jgi:hypothetical protein
VANTYWFPAKRYGWGWGAPTTWQGWAVLAAWFTALAAGMIFLRMRHHPLWWLIYVLGLTALIALVFYWKGEPLRWRSGERSE